MGEAAGDQPLTPPVAALNMKGQIPAGDDLRLAEDEHGSLLPLRLLRVHGGIANRLGLFGGYAASSFTRGDVLSLPVLFSGEPALAWHGSAYRGGDVDGREHLWGRRHCDREGGAESFPPYRDGERDHIRASGNRSLDGAHAIGRGNQGSGRGS